MKLNFTTDDHHCDVSRTRYKAAAFSSLGSSILPEYNSFEERCIPSSSYPKKEEEETVMTS